MRVLFVTAHKHLPELRGGMELNTHDLCRALLRRGIGVGVLCGLAGRGLTGLLARARIRLLGDAAPVDRRLGYPVWRSWNVVPEVERVAGRFRPDVIVLQGGADFEPLARACLLQGVPVVYYAHTPDRLPLAADLAGSRMLHFIANSQYTAALHAGKTIRAVIRPLVPRERYATATDRTLAVFVNPSPYKGLAVVDGLAAARPDVTFLYVTNKRRPAAPGIGSRPNVRIVGPVADMRTVYRRARLVLAPSQWEETWGRIATEAHVSAIPVLGSRSGGLTEAVGPGGLCLERDAPAGAWAGAFSELWDDAARYGGFVAAARAFSLRPEIDVTGIVTAFAEVLEAVR
jgi:glycosyltransferase involved in cell wall biosynthesis